MSVNATTAVLASIGGFVSLCGAVWVVVRSAVRMAASTEDNTRAIRDLNETISRLVAEHNTFRERISYLEGIMKGRGGHREGVTPP